MLAPLLLLWPMSLVVTGVVAGDIANQPYDRELGEHTSLIARQIVIETVARPGDVPRVKVAELAALRLLRQDDIDQVFIQVLGARGEVIAGDRDLPVPEESLRVPGLKFRDEMMGEDRVRVAYQWVPIPGDPQSRGVLVQTAETLQKRSRLATEIVKGVILPQFIILPLAVLLVWSALARGLSPLKRLQLRIRGRDSNDLSPIDETDAPEEVAPLVRAINDLLGRLDQSIASQKHFLADAAHQLKTPLAGLRTQAELAVREIDAGQRDPVALKQALEQIAVSSQRAAHSVNQLLAMARAEDREMANRQQQLDLAELVRDAVRDFVPKAMDKRIDLGYEGADPEAGAQMMGQPILVGELVRNLIDNALQYTPDGGLVTARVLPDPFGQVVVLQVEDSGPGIPAAERELIFQPFYRALGTGVDGTGLGLAIVLEIAANHDAEISVSEAQTRHPGGGPGALFTVRFPRRLPAVHPAANPEGEG
ncbi:MAG: sensor histidine kinase N-terminal domain-containing protein [Rubrivivax sp.]|nr:sensor histidine kinase N-terminal domain-containing protein [Rubrivivax sp.]